MSFGVISAIASGNKYKTMMVADDKSTSRKSACSTCAMKTYHLKCQPLEIPDNRALKTNTHAHELLQPFSLDISPEFRNQMLFNFHTFTEATVRHMIACFSARTTAAYHNFWRHIAPLQQCISSHLRNQDQTTPSLTQSHVTHVYTSHPPV